jgi:hypothetical protein
VLAQSGAPIELAGAPIVVGEAARPAAYHENLERAEALTRALASTVRRQIESLKDATIQRGTAYRNTGDRVSSNSNTIHDAPSRQWQGGKRAASIEPALAATNFGFYPRGSFYQRITAG